MCIVGKDIALLKSSFYFLTAEKSLDSDSPSFANSCRNVCTAIL